MKISNLALVASLAITVLSGAARAGEEAVGTTAGNFLSVGSGPEVFGRGSATLGLSGDVGMASWNPGALGFLRETQIALSHATLIDQHTQEYLTMGGRLRRTDLRWSAFGLYESEGSFEGRDANNNSTGTFNVSSFAAGGHVAYPIGGIAAVGFGGKWVNESLGESRGAGAAWDAGIQVHSGMLGFGVAAQNAFGKMRFGNQSFNFPTNYGVGMALDHAETGLRLAVDANFPTSYYRDVRTGLEWRWRDLIALRGGYRATLGAPSNEVLNGPTFGFGAGAFGLWMDYGYVIPGSGEAQHRFGLSLRPARMAAGGEAIGQQNLMPVQKSVPATKPVAKPAAKPEAPKTSGTAFPEVRGWLRDNAKPSSPAPIVVVPAPAATQPAPVVKTAPAPAPVVQQVTTPAPVVQQVTTPAPVVQQVTTPAPVVQQVTQPARVVQQATPPAPQTIAPQAASPQPSAPQRVKIEVVPSQVSQQVAEPEQPKKAKKAKKAKKQKRSKDKNVVVKADDAKSKEQVTAQDESEDPFEAAIERAKKLKAGKPATLK